MGFENLRDWEIKVEKVVTSSYKGTVRRYLLSKTGLNLIKKEKVVISVQDGDVRCLNCPESIEVLINCDGQNHNISEGL